MSAKEKIKNVCDEKIFNDLFKSHSKDLHDFLYYKYGANNNPGDIVQLAFEKLWRNCKNILPEKARSFLYTVANNEMLNALSRKKTVMNYSLQNPINYTKETPEFIMEEKEYHDRLQKALEELSEEQRVTFLLNRAEGKKHQEIADMLGIEKRRWVLSNNESVPLLKSQQFSMGIHFNPDKFLVSLEGYIKKVTGIISPSQGFQNQYQFIYSTGEYDAKGLELLVNKRFNRATTWVTYTLAKNDYYFEEFTPSVFPNNLDIRHALSLGGSISLESFEVSAGFNYRTGRPYTQPSQDAVNVFDEIVFEEANSSRLKDYARLDLSAKYSFNIKETKVELDFSVWNLLNRENIYNIFYQVNEDNEIEKITQNTLGFTPNIGVRVVF